MINFHTFSKLIEGYSIAFFLIIVNAFNSTAQNNTNKQVFIFKDSVGNILRGSQWSSMVNSGDFKLLKAVKGSGDTLIVALQRNTTEEKIIFLEKRKADSLFRAEARAKNLFEIGKSFTFFDVIDLKGNKWNSKSLAGKVVVINFWFIDCSPCKKEIPELNNLVDNYENDDVIFLAFALDQQWSLKQFLKTTVFKYNIISESRFLANSLAVPAYPTHVIIDKDGKVALYTVGLKENTISSLKKTIKQLLAE